MKAEASGSPYREAKLRPPARRPPGGAGWVALTAALFGGVAGLVHWRTRPPVTCVRRPPSVVDFVGHRFVGEEPTGERAYVRGGGRFLVEAAGERNARQGRPSATNARVPFASPILGATPVAGGWVFVTEDGGVSFAPSFLAAPRALGHLPCASRVDFGGRGLATVVDVAGGLLVTDGERPFAPLATPGPVRAALFTSREEGAVVLRDGGVAVSRDGGRTWRAVELNGDVGWSLERAGCLRLETLTRVYCLDARGELRAASARAMRLLPPADVVAYQEDGALEPEFRSPRVARCDDPGARLPEPPGPRFVCRPRGGFTFEPNLPVAPHTARWPPIGRGAHHSVHAAVRSLWIRRADGLSAVGAFWSSPTGSPAGSTTARLGRHDLDLPFFDERTAAYAMPVAATRAGLLLRNDVLRRLVWGRSGGGFVRVGEPLYDLLADAPIDEATLSLPARDGGALVLLSREVFRGGTDGAWATTDGLVPWREAVGVALDLAPTGAVRARRPGAFGPITAGLAQRGDVRGYVLHRGSSLTLHPVGGGAPVALPSLPSTCVLPCRGSDPSRWVVALPRGCATLADVELDPLTVGAVELEVGERGVCLRAIHAAGRHAAWLVAARPRAAEPDVVLRGLLDADTVLSCALAPSTR